MAMKVSPQAEPRKAMADARAESEVAEESTEPAPTEGPPVEPSPEPTIAPSPDGTPSPGGSPSPAPSPTQRAPAPQPFTAAVGFDYGRPVKARAPIGHSASVSCTKDVLDQRLETVVEDDDSPVTYPALLELHWGPASKGALTLELTVWKNGHEVYYSGTGELVDGAYGDGKRELRFMGNYGTLNPNAQNMDMPASGRFTAGLALDCAALSVITESVVLGA